MKFFSFIPLLIVWSAPSLLIQAADKPSTAANQPSTVFNRVRFWPAAGEEQAMVGGRFCGSNVSRTEGFETLAEITTAPPAHQWSEIQFKNNQVYRWLRYEAPQGSHGKVADLEFYAGERKLSGKGNAYGLVVKDPGHGWPQAFDGNPKSWAESENADGQYIGVDLRELATARNPQFFPPLPGPPLPSTPPALVIHQGPLDVTIKSATPGAIIRYTLDGTWPTLENGLVYTAPIHIEKTTTFQAVAFLKGHAPSAPMVATYLIKGTTQPGLSTFHWGNSLTQTTSMLSPYVRTAGFAHQSALFGRPGAWTKELWDIGLTEEKERADGLWNSLPHIDHLTLQPRDFDIAEEAGYDIQFFDLARKKSPDMQPWLYCEWTEMKRERPTDRGDVTSQQMKKTFPALTWEESMGAMLLYVEELQQTICETYHEGKRPRVLPTALAMGWIKNMIDHGHLPGIQPGSFYTLLFNDQVHPSVNPLIHAQGNGGYLVDLTWFSAFYQTSPVGRLLPIGTTFTTEQSEILQKLAWDVIQNYPDCGIYQAGTDPCAKPVITRQDQTLTLHSATPGAWFRYTLDGSMPTHTTGYVYCGVISVQTGIQVKAIAYKNGMADSEVAEMAP